METPSQSYRVSPAI